MSESEKPIEMINPPNMLRVKVGGRVPQTDPAAVARAEAALDELRHEFRGWLEEEVEKLEAAMAKVRSEGLAGEAGEELFNVAHDLRGLGTTYEFPIVTRICASLAKLIETEEKRAAAPKKLVDAHVGAVRAALLQNVRDECDEIGRQLVETLEGHVVELVGESD
ncbi:Hpt domain-containing protein [Marinicauda salina]|uniref:Hpt domain-containing protein n=1 Tax=Marinicauda salina TaxID=2135793 RepID=A0A2U2BRH0_9PROT|nr:Hpt domain-containing protein [Marinicauda salina]PWE16602.1 Hpt domain-containing protein [Marinicauda salina]